MAHLKKRGNIIWIKYYDTIERKYKEFSTKCRATVQGWNEARKLLKEFEKRDEFNIKYKEMTTSRLFSEGFNEFLEIKEFKEKTALIYRRVYKLFVDAVGDKPIKEYNEWDYKKFKKFLNEFEYTRANKTKSKQTEEYIVRNLSNNSKGIYTTHLKAIFSFFVKRKYISENFIVPIKKKIKKPEIIEKDDLEIILDHLAKSQNKMQYYLIKFLLLTGFRKSTALDLKWKNIDFRNKVIIANNVKKEREFLFPLTTEVENLLREIQTVSKNLHDVFTFSKDGIKFYWRLQDKLLAEKKLSKRYTLHQLRKTFITRMLEEGISIHNVKALADHRSITTTLNYYTALNINKLREELENVKIFDSPAS